MVQLDPYQVISKDFLKQRQFAGLFDQPGVGKTAPSIVAASEVRQHGLPTLVTAPSYLLPNWRYEISRFDPGANVCIADGAGHDARSQALQAEADYILTGYSNWSAQRSGQPTYPTLVQRQWSALIFDEGHRLRGRNSQCTKFVRQLRGARAVNVSTPIWILTGTPIINNPGDLFPLLALYDKRQFRSYWKFVEQFCSITTTPWATDVGPLKAEAADEFHSLLSEFSLRRTLRDIPKLADLEEQHTTYHVTMPPSVRKTIAKARKDYIVAHDDLGATEFVSGGGALYSRLRQLATDPPTAAKPKVDFVRDFLEDHPERLAVYVWYKASSQAVADGLSKSKRPVIVVTGDVPSDQRAGLVDKWSTDPGAILVATISSLKEGISLVAGSTVIFLEHSELPADQEQVVARFKRRGQHALVNVHHVIADGTPDTAIEKALTNRKIGIKRALEDWLRECETRS